MTLFCADVLAQDPIYEPFFLNIGTHGKWRYSLEDDWVTRSDLLTGQRDSLAQINPWDIWLSNTLPSTYSVGLSKDGRYVWLWDRSVGPVVRLDVEEKSFEVFPVRSSHIQFQHGGGLSPERQVPFAISGYGYYRAKSFVTEFDPDLRTWDIASYSTWDNGPQPRTDAMALSGFDDRHIVMVGGATTGAEGSSGEYQFPSNDAWVLDTKDQVWTQIGLTAWMQCGLLDSGNKSRFQFDAFRPVVLLVVQEPCLALFPDLLPGLYAWYPTENRINLVSDLTNVPSPSYYEAVYHDRVSDSYVVVYRRQPNSELPPESWTLELDPEDIQQTIYLDPPGKMGMHWGAYGLMLLLLGSASLFWVKARRTPPLPARIDVASLPDRLIVSVGGESFVHLLSPQQFAFARLIAQKSAAGDLPVPVATVDEELDFGGDEYATKVARNRAIDHLNELVSIHLDEVFIRRIKDSGDRRRVLLETPLNIAWVPPESESG